MLKSVLFRFAFLILVPSLTLFPGCSGDEGGVGGGIPATELMLVEFRNPIEIEVDSDQQLALLLHDRSSPSGPALQLVDLNEKRVLATLILDYFDVYDVEFISSNQACFAGRPQGNIGYAVQFFDLPSLTLTSRVMTAGPDGDHGYLDVNEAGTIVYYSHAGTGQNDAVYAIAASSKMLIDADNDGQAPFAFDNELVSGTFAEPGQIFFDEDSDRIVVANSADNYVTMIDQNIWGTLSRDAGEVFPVPGIYHWSTAVASLPDVRAEGMAGAGGFYAFAGMSAETAYLARFLTESGGVDSARTFTDREWVYRNRDIRIHPRQDIFSLFILQEDSNGVAIGQYRLNNLGAVAGSPYRTRHIADSTIAAVGLDLMNDRLLVADEQSERIEFINLAE